MESSALVDWAFKGAVLGMIWVWWRLEGRDDANAREIASLKVVEVAALKAELAALHLHIATNYPSNVQFDKLVDKVDKVLAAINRMEGRRENQDPRAGG